MAGSIRIDTSALHMGRLKIKSFQVKDALAHAAEEILLPASREAVPKVSTNLANSAAIKKSRGGTNTIAIVYDSVYARWIHEHLHFKHPHGGGAKYLERPMRVKGPATMQAAVRELLKW